MKKILYIESNEDGTIGGSHYCLLEIIKRLDREKYLPLVYFYQDNKLVNEFRKYCKVILKNESLGINIRKTSPSIYKFLSKNKVTQQLLMMYQKIGNFVFYYLPYYVNIIYVLIKHRPAAIHMNDVPVLTQWLLIAKLFGIVVISHIRGHWSPVGSYKRFVKLYDQFISISHSVTEFVVLNGVNADKVVTIYDGIDTKTVINKKTRSRNEMREELGINEEEFVVCVVGNIKRWKGQHVAIKAIKTLKEKGIEMKCLIVGDTSKLQDDCAYHNYLTEYTKNNNLSDNIIFTGYRSDIPDIVSSVDTLLLTSTEPEPLGRVVFEGMLFERPVIATSHGGPAEILQDGITGILVPPNDEFILSEKIEYLEKNSQIAEIIGVNARKEVMAKYDIGTNIGQIQEIYRRYIG